MMENIDNIVRRILRSIWDGPETNNSDTSNASRPSTLVQPQDLQEEFYARFDIPKYATATSFVHVHHRISSSSMF